MPDGKPQSFDKLVAEARRAQPLTIAGQRALRKDQEQRERAAEEQKREELRTALWDLVSRVHREVIGYPASVAGESSLIGAGYFDKYRRVQWSQTVPARWRRARLAKRAVRAWDLAAEITFPWEAQGASGVAGFQLFLGAGPHGQR